MWIAIISQQYFRSYIFVGRELILTVRFTSQAAG